MPTQLPVWLLVRGLDPVVPDDPLHDQGWIELVQGAYPLAPPPVISESD